MKFSQVSIGQQFNYQGHDYTKSGPLTATLESDGRSKLIPRSANVKLLTLSGSGVTVPTEQKLLSSEGILNAVNDYHGQCLDSMNVFKDEISSEIIADIQIQLNNCYQQLVEKINQMDDLSH